ncbi:MAG: hypothetical protein GY701_35210, partial [Sulfitobacter sp.]|nr:hypothetical protein [Sulfitobacter sp.]
MASVVGTAVTFTTPKARFYGDASNSDSNIGTAGGDQKVILLRVPDFGDLTVPSGATLDVAPWDGLTGGVLMLRARNLTVEGTI